MPWTSASRALARSPWNGSRAHGAASGFVVPGLTLTLAFLAPLATLFVVSMGYVLDRGFSVVHQCVPATGVWGMAGVHLALVRETTDCPAGTAALGGDPGAAVTVVGVLALPVLLGHVMALLAGWGASSYLHRVHERVGRMVTPRIASLLDVVAAPLPVVRRGAAQVVSAVVRPLRHLVLAAVQPRRGPPSGRLSFA